MLFVVLKVVFKDLWSTKVWKLKMCYNQVWGLNKWKWILIYQNCCCPASVFLPMLVTSASDKKKNTSKKCSLGFSERWQFTYTYSPKFWRKWTVRGIHGVGGNSEVKSIISIKYHKHQGSFVKYSLTLNKLKEGIGNWNKISPGLCKVYFCRWSRFRKVSLTVFKSGD